MIRYCLICERRILSHVKLIDCKVCHESCHLKCLSLDESVQLYYISNASNWYCCHFLGNALPFNHILEDDVFHDALYCKDNIDIDWESFSPAMFHLFGVLAAINHPLVYILNLSMSEGLFPDELKIANVVPIYKAKIGIIEIC